MSKRAKFVATSIILSLGFVAINFLGFNARFVAIAILSAATIGLFWYSLAEGIRLDATLLTLVLPFLYTIGVGLFWFLLPTTPIARLPVVIFYSLGIYALCLTANIFSVSAVRTIALTRAARGVGFVLSLITSFLLFDAILSLRANIFLTLGLILLVSLLIFVQGLWVSNLERKISMKLLASAAVLSLCLVEISALLYFWPVSVVIGSLFLTVGVYILLGLGQANLEERLFAKTLREYVLVGLVVFLAIIFFTKWGA